MGTSGQPLVLLSPTIGVLTSAPPGSWILLMQCLRSQDSPGPCRARLPEAAGSSGVDDADSGSLWEPLTDLGHFMF